MDAEKFYRLADEAMLQKTAYSQSIAQSAALISIAISLHRLAERSPDPSDLDLRQLNPLLRKVATSSVYDPGETDLDDEQPINLSITLGDVRTARRLLG